MRAYIVDESGADFLEMDIPRPALAANHVMVRGRASWPLFSTNEAFPWTKSSPPTLSWNQGLSERSWSNSDP